MENFSKWVCSYLNWIVHNLIIEEFPFLGRHRGRPHQERWSGRPCPLYLLKLCNFSKSGAECVYDESNMCIFNPIASE